MKTREKQEDIQLVTFKLASEEYGIPIEYVREIIRLVSITRIPKAPSFVEGIINLRGTVLPIIDFRTRFDLSKSEDVENTRIIVIEVQGHSLGVIVDEVNEVARITGDNVNDVPEIVSDGIDGRFLSGVGKINERLLMLLDLNAIFSSEELKKITALKKNTK